LIFSVLWIVVVLGIKFLNYFSIHKNMSHPELCTQRKRRQIEMALRNL